MKIMITLTIIGMIGRFMAITPAVTLPKYPVMGTEKIETSQEQRLPDELRYMTKKMYYLKTGRRINTEASRKRLQNYWGKGVPAQVRFPSHLAEWEETRKMGKSVKVRSLSG